jgi:LPS export ABC transporter protein LptC
MQRLAKRVLIAVALFSLIVTGLLVVRGRSGRVESPEPQPSAADLAMKDVQLQEEGASGNRWQLRADHVAVFEAEGRTALRNVTIRVQDREGSWTIVGEEGDFFKESRNLEIRRNVVMISQDGMRLETAVLRWQDAERRLWTDAPVRIVRPGAVINGRALEVRLDQAATRVEGRVRATFGRGPGT